MDSPKSHSSSDKVKTFSDHNEACNYAKANLGFIVIPSGQGWIVGERNAVLAIKKQESFHANKKPATEEWGEYDTSDDLFLIWLSMLLFSVRHTPSL